MRLINTQTLKLEEHEDPIPPYAILSHTWGRQEVDFRRFQGMGEQEREEFKAGDSKIGRVCRIARCHGHGYVWVDTCCIDKSSSADLSEAVNSMYRYYQDAQVCYVYLADVVAASKGENEGKARRESLRRCRWFRRGWTLQELIAPRRVTFYDEAWERLGDKTDPALLRLLSSITSIDEDVLGNAEPVTSVPVSTRMAWAADRCCTRQEDVAYSLMGIFDVNMPLLYGEGSKAFARLQEEISRRNLDLSLLAWASGDGGERHRGLLARSPAEFRIFQKVTLVRGTLDGQSEVTVANGCLRLSGKVFTRTCRASSSSTTTMHILDLGWVGKRGSSGFFWRVGVLLQRALGAFVRAAPQKLFAVKLEDVQHTRALHMRMSLTPSDLESLRRLLPVADLGTPSSSSCCPDEGEGEGEGKQFGTTGQAPPRIEYEWGSYTSTGCRTKQIETMFDHGLCLDMRHHNQNGRVLRGLEPWALRPTLFWKVWPGGSGNAATAVKVFLRYYDTPSSRRHTTAKKDPHDRARLAATAEPPRKRRRDGQISSAAAATHHHHHHSAAATNTNTNTPTVTNHQPSYSVLFQSRSLACPFYVRDKLRHTACKDDFLRTVQDVQQHLWRAHVRRAPPYCPVCGRSFGGIGERDAHIVGGACEPRRQLPPPPTTTTTATNTNTTTTNSKGRPRENSNHNNNAGTTEGGGGGSMMMMMTEDQHRRVLAAVSKKCAAPAAAAADFEVWYRVWEELFPGARYPPSVWLGDGAEEISEITSLIWNRFLADMRKRTTTTTTGKPQGGGQGGGWEGEEKGEGEEEDEDVVKHFELSQLSATSTSWRTTGGGARYYC